MKKVFGKLSNTKCILILFFLVVIAMCLVGASTTSYFTSKTQYSAASPVTPYKISNEVLLSFERTQNSSTTPSPSGTQIYTESKYNSSSDNGYYMIVENYSNVKDYSDTELSSSNVSAFVEFYGVLKKDGDYGTLTDSSHTYNDCLVTETTAGSLNASYTTINIAPFDSDVTVTVYCSMGSRSSNYKSLFYFNSTEIAYGSSIPTSATSTGVTYCDSGTSGNYSYTAGTDHSAHELYTYQTTVSAEQATSIVVGSQSQTMIFLISISPVSNLVLTPSGGGASGTSLTGSLEVDGTQTITATVTASSTFSATNGLAYSSSNEAVATVSAVYNNPQNSLVAAKVGSRKIYALAEEETGSEGTTTGTTYTYTITVTAKSPGTATIYITAGGKTAEYNVYVKGVAVSGSSTVGKGGTTQLTASYIGDSGVGSATFSWEVTSGSDYVSVEADESDSSIATVTAGSKIGTATITATSSSYSTEFEISVVNITTINITKLVDDKTLSATTYTEETALGSDSYSTVSVTATSDKSVGVGSSSQSIDGYKFNYCLKLGGTGSSTARSIKLVLNNACSIKVYAMSGSSSSTRNLVLYDTDYKSTEQSFATTGTISSYTYTVSSAGTYYIASAGSGINIYCIEIQYSDLLTISGESGETSSALAVGDTATLTAKLNDEEITDAVTWTSSNEKVATVSGSNGTATVTAVAAGEATITAAIGTTTATYTVTVSNTLTVTSNTSSDILDSETNSTNELTLTATFNGTAVSSSSTVTWEVTSGSDYVSLTSNTDGTATVTAVSAGAAVITATVSGETCTYDVYVTGYMLTATSSTVSIGGTSTLTLYYYDGTSETENINKVTVSDDLTVSWESSDTDIATVAESNASNEDNTTTYGATVTGVAVGTATITVSITADSKTYTATYTVTVKELTDTTITFESATKASISQSDSGITVNMTDCSTGTSIIDNSKTYTSIKFETDTTITIKGITSGATVKLYMYSTNDSPAVKINGTSESFTVDSDTKLGTVEITVDSANDFVLTKDSTNTNIYKIEISYSSNS